jgi:hypothetical protein
MIRYRLKCDKRHEFDAWFATSVAYDRQRKRSLVQCPRCGSDKVEKALMAPNVAKKSGRRAPKPQSPPEQPPVDSQRVAAHGELVQAMRKLRTEIESKSENVGTRFPEEARKIHYEETPARGIHGEATRDEAHALREEGIEFFPLPILPEDQN